MPASHTPSLVRAAPTAVSIRNALAEGRLSAEAAMQAALARIREVEPQLHAWQHLDAEAALARARAFDHARASGTPPGLLAGVPLAVKDIFDTADMPTGYGAAVHAQHRPAHDAEVVARCRAAGAVPVGKTVTTEFAYFAPGPTANAWNPAHTPGGSSSGSAVAVASGMVPLALGSQTAGSLIRPASYCGVFALKPTYGLVPTAGAKPFSDSLDTIGWLANTADDLELMRAALTGQPYAPLQTRGPRQLRLGLCRTHEWAQLDVGGRQVWDAAERAFRTAGITLVTLDLPDTLAGLMPAQKTVMAFEAARSLAHDIDTHGERLSSAIRDLVRTGRGVTPEAYAQAQALAAEGRRVSAQMLASVDALVAPAAPGEAPAGLAATGDPVFSRVWTLLGLPCVNLPGLRGPQGLPVGVQLVGAAGADRALLEVAASLHPVLMG